MKAEASLEDGDFLFQISMMAVTSKCCYIDYLV